MWDLFLKTPKLTIEFSRSQNAGIIYVQSSNCVCMNLFIYVYGTIARKLKYKPTLFIEILKMKYLEINLMSSEDRRIVRKYE